MIKVLDKTFLILEKLALQSPRPCRIGELAEEFGLNNATCARILKELVEAGYAIHLSRLTGYTVGPRSWTVASTFSRSSEVKPERGGAEVAPLPQIV